MPRSSGQVTDGDRHCGLLRGEREPLFADGSPDLVADGRVVFGDRIQGRLEGRGADLPAAGARLGPHSAISSWAGCSTSTYP
jgi:hypothetical protein